MPRNESAQCAVEFACDEHAGIASRSAPLARRVGSPASVRRSMCRRLSHMLGTWTHIAPVSLARLACLCLLGGAHASSYAQSPDLRTDIPINVLNAGVAIVRPPTASGQYTFCLFWPHVSASTLTSKSKAYYGPPVHFPWCTTYAWSAQVTSPQFVLSSRGLYLSATLTATMGGVVSATQLSLPVAISYNPSNSAVQLITNPSGAPVPVSVIVAGQSTQVGAMANFGSYFSTEFPLVPVIVTVPGASARVVSGSVQSAQVTFSGTTISVLGTLTFQ
jgi:hypothetical protein